MLQIREHAMQLKPHYESFANRLYRLAAAYEEEKIKTLLEQYVGIDQ